MHEMMDAGKSLPPAPAKHLKEGHQMEFAANGPHGHGAVHKGPVYKGPLV